jgi:hypothetical protein
MKKGNLEKAVLIVGIILLLAVWLTFYAEGQDTTITFRVSPNLEGIQIYNKAELDSFFKGQRDSALPKESIYIPIK